MRRLAADDRSIAVAASRSRLDPEALIRRVAVTSVGHPQPEQDRKATRNRVVLVGAARDRNDHAVEEFMAAIAVLLRSEVVHIGCPTREVQQHLHATSVLYR